jgi:hypothetical protein
MGKMEYLQLKKQIYKHRLIYMVTKIAFTQAFPKLLPNWKFISKILQMPRSSQDPHMGEKTG